jgi:ABC-type antimicrobial peptide transport system permease subunit
LDKRHDYLGNWQGGTITLDDVTSDMVLQGNLDDLKIPGTAAVFQAVGAAVGDEVTLQYGEYELNAVIAAVLADNKHLVTPYGYFDEDTGKNVIGTRSYVFCSADTLSSLFGFEEALYTSWLTIYAKKGYEKEAVRRIEDIADIDMSEDEYASIHEQWEFAVGLIGSNIYLTDKKYAAIEIFLCLFLAAQIAFLFISAALIISSINNFNINKRRGEFAIIRALGEQRSNIVNAIKRASFINAVFVAVTAIITSLSFLIFMSFTVSMSSAYGTLEDWAEMVVNDLLRIYSAYIFTFAFMICVNLISSLKSAKKTTGNNLINDIRKY